MKAESYRAGLGFEHYGIDMVNTGGDITLHASGIANRLQKLP